ncbi:MAG: PadR family transcriptional regulator [Acetobacter sp.]|nr:PadR family transcriptional regulator [Bacteroides sp.]MCM1341094.1 PadR family transcriptional regulator [Acetobacter sp.]MCM1433573.1 PadR family transcriptional regulator [Clostridiales bacterium]
MSQNQDNFKRGTAELLVLHLLQKEDLYGYQITQSFEQKSNGVYTMLEGSLYPILYKLVEAGYISDYTEIVGKRRTRRYYHLEDKGRSYLKEILNDYDKITEAISKILDRNEKGDDNDGQEAGQSN